MFVAELCVNLFELEADEDEGDEGTLLVIVDCDDDDMALFL